MLVNFTNGGGSSMINTSTKTIAFILRHLEGYVWFKDDSVCYDGYETCQANGYGVDSIVRDGDYYAKFVSSWHLSKRFMIESTFFNTVIVVVIISIWVLNRQTHIRQTKGSKIKYKKDEEDYDTSGGEDDSSNDDDDEDDDSDDDLDHDVDEDAGYADDEREKKEAKQDKVKCKKKRKRRKSLSDVLRSRQKSMKAFLTVATEIDDDDNIHKINNYVNKSDDESILHHTDEELMTDDEQQHQQQQKRSQETLKQEKLFLWNLMKKVEAFSYLNEDAQMTCAEYVEYIDIESKGSYVFKQNEYDGSFYAVISGRVKCQFHNHLLPMNNQEMMCCMDEHEDDQDNQDDHGKSNVDGNENINDMHHEKILSFSSGPGDVVTPMLAVFGGLVQYELFDRNSNKKNGEKKILPLEFANGVSVIATESKTRLIRLKPDAISILLEKYPSEVYRIIQSVICRTQRVSIQVLVKTLGLRSELFANVVNATNYTAYKHSINVSSSNRKIDSVGIFEPEFGTPHRNQWDEFIRSQRKLCNNPYSIFNNNDKNNDKRNDVLQSMKKDAAKIFAKRFGIPTEGDGFNLLMNFSSIISVPQGETLIQSGFPHDSIYLLLYGQLELGLSIPRRRTGVTTKKTSSIAKNSNKFFFHRKLIVKPGCVVGKLPAFSGDISLFTIRCCRDNNNKSSNKRKIFNQNDINNNSNTSILLKIPKNVFQKFLMQYPFAMIRCLETFFKLLSPVVHLLNWNSDWMHVQAAQLIAKKKDVCDSMFVVLNGRLRADLLSSKNSTISDINYHTTISPSFQNHARSYRKSVSTSKRNHHHRDPIQYLRQEYGCGKCIGDIEVLTNNIWPYDVYTTRNSEIAKIPMKTLLTIIAQFPQAGLYFAQSIASRVQQDNNKNSYDHSYKIETKRNKSKQPSIIAQPSTELPLSTSRNTNETASTSNDSNVVVPSYALSMATIAVVPLTSDADMLSDFCRTLQSSLQQHIAPTKLMTKKIARRIISDKNAHNRFVGSSREGFRETNNKDGGSNKSMFDLRMSRLLGDFEENSRLVLYQADVKYTWWTKLCIQQADVILLVVMADKAPEHYRVEQCLQWAYESMDVRIDIVVVNANKNSGKRQPKYERINLQRSISEDNNEENENNNNEDDFYDNDEEINVSDQLHNWFEEREWVSGQHIVRRPFHRHETDFFRLCRRVTGISIGLALGGGGARGLAHVGIIRALMEAGVTIDMVGGSSQGAFIGALYAKNPDNFSELLKSSKEFSARMSSKKELLFDLTLPLTSMFHGGRFNRAIRKFFRKLRIQDLVLNYFCMTTDLQKPGQVIHTKGLLWKYVRASMSLTGYLPPVAENGSLLCDGGYTNVLPADVMKYTMGARTVIGVDVTPECKRDYIDYGTSLSGWYLLLNSWNPFVKTVRVPSIGDINDILRWVSSEQHRKNIDFATDLYLRPKSIMHYGTLDYVYCDEIIEKGYQYAKPIVDEWVRKNPWLVSSSTSLPSHLHHQQSKHEAKNYKELLPPLENS